MKTVTTAVEAHNNAETQSATSNPNQQVVPVKAPNTTELVPPLTQAETELLAKHEETISKGIKEFKEVYVALKEIRTNCLYRQEYSTFQDYCLEKWGITARHANRIMLAGKVMANIKADQLVSLVPTAVPANESQARYLAPLTPAHQLEVAREVAKTKGKPTAKHFKDAADKVAAKPTEPEHDPEEEEDVPHIEIGVVDDPPKSPVKTSSETKTIVDLQKLLQLVDAAEVQARNTTGCTDIVKTLHGLYKTITQKIKDGAV